MAGRAVPMMLSAVAGIALGSVATMLLTSPPDHRGEMPAVAQWPAPAQTVTATGMPAPVTGEDADILAARHALAARLRSPDALHLTEVRVYAYGPQDERAVCGVMQSAEITGGSARFVVRVLQPRGAGTRLPQAVVEDAPWLVRPSPEAGRRFCRDPEAEAAAATAAAQAAPPPVVAPAPAPTPQPLPAAEGQRGGRVVTQSPANLRAAPSGEVLMSVPRGRNLLVFDRAPGGWLQVGETAPQGWIHSSLLSDVQPQ